MFFQRILLCFFNSRTCPDGWKPLVDSEGVQYDGYYPRIGAEGSSEIGTIKEQMVHKHKHVSPFLPYYGLQMKNQLRYGPYSYPGSLWTYYPMDVRGDGWNYPQIPNVAHYQNSVYVPNGSLSNRAISFYGVGYQGEWHYNTIAYTSDGVNTTERLFGIRDNNVNMMVKNFTVCPNRDENDRICKPAGNNYNIPYLAEMPLVGDENRPNSIVLLACQRD